MNIWKSIWLKCLEFSAANFENFVGSYFKKILLNISNKKQTFEAPKPPFYRSIGTSGLEWTWMNILGLPSKMNGL